MKLIDLLSQYNSIKEEIDEAINNVIVKSDFIQGEALKNLELNIAEYCNTKYAVGLNSGTDALIYALQALEIGPGDEIITTPFTFIATAECIVLVGATPIFVDINPQTYNIDVEEIEKKITKNTKVIIPVHLYGQPADMDKILSIGKKHDIKVIEDAAQAIGAEYKGGKVCSLGDMASISFYPAKNLGAYGDAGMLVSNDESITKKINMMINHGSKKRYYHEFIGDSSRLDNIQAAILNVKLKYLDQWNDSRRKIAYQYNELLRHPKITTPFELPGTKCVYQQYTIRIRERDKVKKYLADKGIPTAIHYPIPLHLQPAFQNLNLGYSKGHFPHAEQASAEVLSLPMYPELPLNDVELISETIIKQVKKYESRNTRS